MTLAIGAASSSGAGPSDVGRKATAAVAGRGVLLATAALGIAHLHIAGRPATFCPLRALTGIPCPLCGGTTAAVRLGHLDLVAALRANPFVILAAVAIVVAPVHRLMATRGWSARVLRERWWVVALALALSEVWQLVRFGVW